MSIEQAKTIDGEIAIAKKKLESNLRFKTALEIAFIVYQGSFMVYLFDQVGDPNSSDDYGTKMAALLVTQFYRARSHIAYLIASSKRSTTPKYVLANLDKIYVLNTAKEEVPRGIQLEDIVLPNDALAMGALTALLTLVFKNYSAEFIVFFAVWLGITDMLSNGGFAVIITLWEHQIRQSTQELVTKVLGRGTDVRVDITPNADQDDQSYAQALELAKSKKN